MSRNAARVPAHRNSSKSGVHSVVGTSVMPPRSPLGSRVRTSRKPSARRTTKAAPRRSAPSRLGILGGKVSASPRARPMQLSFHGQKTQAGFFGVQIVAPRSIIACAKSPAAVAARARGPAQSGLASGNGPASANSRAITRSILPSTGLAGGPKAIAAIAAAVYAPIPGRSRKSASVCGNPAVAHEYGACAGVQIARPRVVAKPRPGLHDFPGGASASASTSLQRARNRNKA